MSTGNALSKIINHPDKEEIVAKLVLDITPQEVNAWLREKYEIVGDAKLVIGVATLKKFKDEYLDLYKTIQNDAMAMYSHSVEEAPNTDPLALVNSSKEYKRLLHDYLEKEVDLKTLMKEMIVAVRARIEQLFVLMQQNPHQTKPDYVMIQWVQTLTNLLEKQENIINGSPDKIIQQNNINIQILDQHVNVFQKVIREVISRLDYETSLLFVDILNEELTKLKPTVESVIPIDLRLSEVRKLEQNISNQLDMPDV
jgi:hypothetical protein